MMAQDVESKTAALQEVFFPTPPSADLSDIAGYQYGEAGEWHTITQEEIREAIHQVPPDKAPGPDGLPNRIIKLACRTMVPQLAVIFNASIRLHILPSGIQELCGIGTAKARQR